MTRSHFLRVHIEEIMNISRSDIPLIDTCTDPVRQL